MRAQLSEFGVVAAKGRAGRLELKARIRACDDQYAASQDRIYDCTTPVTWRTMRPSAGRRASEHAASSPGQPEKPFQYLRIRIRGAPATPSLPLPGVYHRPAWDSLLVNLSHRCLYSPSGMQQEHITMKSPATHWYAPPLLIAFLVAVFLSAAYTNASAWGTRGSQLYSESDGPY